MQFIQLSNSKGGRVFFYPPPFFITIYKYKGSFFYVHFKKKLKGDGNMENKDIIRKDENGNILFGELWFNVENGVVELTSDILQFISPTDKFMRYLQNALDLIQEGLYYQFVDEQLKEKDHLDVDQELKDIEEMFKEEEEEEGE